LVPLDGSPLSETALGLAQQLATALKVPLTLLRVVETVYFFSDPAPGSAAAFQEMIDALQEATNSYLSDVERDLRSKRVTVTSIAPLGFPASEIEDYVRKNPGTLVVMATHGRTGVAGAVLGSVARRVVGSVAAPVVLVRPIVNPVLSS